MPRTPQTRHERLTLTGAALSGAVSGTVRAVITWLLEQLSP
ncbi:hypothetical protein [Streptomyces bullii]|uniref:Uncharacterized protein n=1 Tax=Streptomyces bullii TaxID=349910 RepID=A0ABW0V3K2_9ACTN